MTFRALDTQLEIPSDLKPIRGPLGLLEAFVAREYECYDGIPVTHDAVLRPEEIAISVMVNSQISGNTARAIWELRKQVEEHLGAIDAELSLATPETEVPWESIEGAIAAICTVKRAKIAVATKILHKKRPELIPMLDSVIVDHYRPLLPPGGHTTQAGLAVRIIRVFRTDLMAVLDRLRGFERHFMRKQRPLTLCRILEILLWVSNEPRGYYR